MPASSYVSTGPLLIFEGCLQHVTEDPVLTDLAPNAHNAVNDWQREFRIGHFDLVAARYALEMAGPTNQLGITSLDRPVDRQVATSYTCHDHTIRRLVPGPFTDLDYQEHELTKTLLATTPNYHRAPATREGYVDYLAAIPGANHRPGITTRFLAVCLIASPVGRL